MASFWLNSVLLVSISGLTAAAILSHQTPDLSKVKVGADATDHAPLELVEMLGQAVIKHAAQVEISEADVNDYLARRLKPASQGRSGRLAKFQRVLLNFDDGHCTAHLCWDVLGHTDVISVQFSIQRKGSEFVVEIERGAYGNLPVSRGFLTPALPAMQEVVRACKPEIDAIFKLPHLRIAKDKLVLDAKF
ncbi:MAG: hypothetical protein JWO08_2136 [Verrucomicrobiaceae bacterium]|nr:hypothetical protein [Verrucomicrobiaceae bacterium]